MLESCPQDHLPRYFILIVSALSSVFSFFIDNPPWTATLLRVVSKPISKYGIPSDIAAYTIVYSVYFGGAAVITGSLQNVIVANIYYERTRRHMSFVESFKLGFLMVCILLAISVSYTILVYDVIF